MAPQRGDFHSAEASQKNYQNNDASSSGSISPRTPESLSISPFSNLIPVSEETQIRDKLATKYFQFSSENHMHDELIDKIRKMTQHTDELAGNISSEPSSSEVRHLNPQSYSDQDQKTKNLNVDTVKLNNSEDASIGYEGRQLMTLTQKEKEGCVATSEQFPTKLPFLDEIKKFRRNDETYATKSYEKSDNDIESIRETKRIEQCKPLPFISDIMSLGKFKAQTKERKGGNYSDSHKIISDIDSSDPKIKYVKKVIQSKITQYNERREEMIINPNLESFVEIENTEKLHEKKVEETHRKEICENSGIKNLKNILSQNRLPKQKKVTFSVDTVSVAENRPTKDKNYTTSKSKENPTHKFPIKIDMKTNMSSLADQILPQLNTMQKNYLGLLFFHELSENIVQDILVQELSKMDSPGLESLINNLEPKVCDTAAPILMRRVSEELRTLLVCDAFDGFKTQEKAALVYTAGNDVMEVCSHVSEYGGRKFKRSLIQSLLSKEDKLFRKELIQELGNENLFERNYQNSEDDENYSSAEETF